MSGFSALLNVCFYHFGFAWAITLLDAQAGERPNAS